MGNMINLILRKALFGATVNKVLNSKKNLTIWGNSKERDLLI